MKFLKILLLALALVSTVETNAQLVNSRVLVANPAKPGYYVMSPIWVTNGILTANTLVATNGLTVSSGTVDFTGISTFTIPSNLIPATAVSGVAASAGAADAGKVAKLDGEGLIGATLYRNPIVRTTQFAPRDVSMSTSYVWTHCTNITTTATNGVVFVKGSVACAQNGSYLWARIRDNVGTTNIIGVCEASSSATGANIVIQPQGWDTLTGTAKTYYMDVAWANGTGTLSITNGPILSGNLPVHGASGN